MPEPFLRWAGGKRWLVSYRPDLFASLKFERYFEPFLGSGAVYFHVEPEKAFLSDINRELIDTYIAIRDAPEVVESLLLLHHERHSKNHYYAVRGKACMTLAETAARFIYLNRTCWNGLYRVNLKGEFNVPIGTKTRVMLPTDDFRRVSSLLKKAVLVSQDFEDSLGQCCENDFVFIDPPYTVCHNNNGFLKYNEHIFSWEDQIRLRDAVTAASARGAKILVLNAYQESVIGLYRDFPRMVKLNRPSVLSANPVHRKQIEELMVLTWSDHEH
jgi:DNA adenine methylase